MIATKKLGVKVNGSLVHIIKLQEKGSIVQVRGNLLHQGDYLMSIKQIQEMICKRVAQNYGNKAQLIKYKSQNHIH